MIQTIYRPIKDLINHPDNPRTIKDDNFERLCQSISENPDYFETRPLILSDRTGDLVIIAGNMRFRAAKELKLKEVPTALIPGLTEEREKEIMIRDNVSNGEFDFEILANNYDYQLLKSFGVDLGVFDIDLPGAETIKDKNRGVNHVCPNCGHEWAGSPR